MNEQPAEEKMEDSTSVEPQEITVASPSVSANDSVKPKKKKKKKIVNEFSKKGSIRGIETMFKSSYTTQLALTDLADNKANIMISINGLILSIIIAASSSNIASNSYLLIPVGVLLLSSLTAIFLAIRAARPAISNAVPPTREDFLTGKANALFFAHFSTLSADEYLEILSTIMKSRKLTYRVLIKHTHGLGMGLVRKFKLLQWSYTIFITGLGLSIALFLIISIFFTPTPASNPINTTKHNISPTATPAPKALEKIATPVAKSQPIELPVFTEFRTLDTVNESSGIQQLPDGRFLVINDEKDHPMDLLSLDDQGQFTAIGLFPDKIFDKDGVGSEFRKLTDLEGIDIDNDGYLYAITSHAYNSKGEKGPNREKLIRFKIEGDTIVEPGVISNLSESIAKQHPFLAKALAETDSKSVQGFNIEGLTLNPLQDKLLIGLRTPLIDNKAVVIGLDNVKEAFLNNAPPQISSKVSLLDLAGNGIRSLNYFPLLNGYLIMAGPIGKSDNVPFSLWLWCGDTDTAQPVTVTGLNGFEETEGMAPMLWHGEPRVVMITDGTLDNTTVARYIILKYDQFNIKNKCAKS